MQKHGRNPGLKRLKLKQLAKAVKIICSITNIDIAEASQRVMQLAFITLKRVGKIRR
jgi:hypothetical protein